MPVKFSIIQSQLDWENIPANLSRFDAIISQIPTDTHIIVLPEMFSTGFSMNATLLAEHMGGDTLNWIKKKSVETKKIITGSIMIEEDGNYYNRLIWMQPDGKYYTYDKRHLFSLAGEEKVFQRGNQRLITSVNGMKIMPMICYDLRFPVWMRQNHEQYDVLVIVANWPAARMYAWDQLLIARAIENQAYVVACNIVGEDGNKISYAGHSQVINPMGEVVEKLIHEQGVIHITIDKKQIDEVRSNIPFLKDADQFKIL